MGFTADCDTISLLYFGRFNDKKEAVQIKILNYR